ncbi:MAG: dihydropyrimidinase [Geminicoccaceae bacterium]
MDRAALPFSDRRWGSALHEFDLVIRGGNVVTAVDRFDADLGIIGERIAALGEKLGPGKREIDARGKLVLPGGIDSHCHIEQLSAFGVMTADDFYSGTVSAAYGGTTTVIPFAAQQRGQSVRQVVDDYREAAKKAVIDHAFHMIVSDPTPAVLEDELPGLIKEGFSSIKLFMTYDKIRVSDEQMLDVLALARTEGAMVVVHAENHGMIHWLAQRLLDKGYTAPRYHAVSHVRLAETEAVSRAIQMAAMIDQPLVIFHISTEGSMSAIRAAQDLGQKIYGETGPQYLFLTADDLDKPGVDGAMWCCSPPPRDTADQAAMWRGLANGTFQVFSSDHAPYSFDKHGKLARGENPDFKNIANGLPGLELRMPLLFSEGVMKGRIDIHRFVELCCTGGARLYGLHPKKGTIAIGSDADIGIWDPDKSKTIDHDSTHDATGYCPYAGMTLSGWPVTVLARSEVIVDDGEFQGERGRGRLLLREAGDAAKPLGRLVPEMDPGRNFGAEVV